MPAPNDLTPEEEAEFANFGVAPAGPGKEPIIEGEGDVQDQGGEQPTAQPSAQPQRDEHGRFTAAGQPPAAAGEPPASGEPPAPAGDGGEQQPRFVPHEALHAERVKAQNAIRQAQLLTTRMNAMLTSQQNGQPEAAALPNLNDDPAGYILALEERLSRFESARQEETQTRQIDQSLEQDEQIFSQSVPDYDAASDHYVQSRARELLQFHTPERAQQILMQEARAIAQQSWQRGISAAQTVYSLAQARGYVPGNTAASPLNAPIPPRPAGGPTPQERVAAVTNGQNASRSLSGGGGGAAPAQLNAEAVLNMSDEEFEQYIQLGSKGANQRFAAIG